MLEPADDRIVRGLAEGREDAFAALYDQFGTALYRAAFMILGSAADAEDAVQDVFVGLVKSRHKLGEVEDLRAYLYTALRRAARRLADSRRAKRTVPLPDAVPLSETRGVDLERSLALERVLTVLPMEQREIVALKIDGGLTFAEIARVLAINANTAASRYRYALEKLRDALTAR